MTHATEITLVFIPFLFLMLSRLYFQREKSIRGRVYDIQKPVDLILNVLAFSWLANVVLCFFPQGADSGFAYWMLAFAISMVVTVVFVGIVGGMSRRLWPDDPHPGLCEDKDFERHEDRCICFKLSCYGSLCCDFRCLNHQ